MAYNDLSMALLRQLALARQLDVTNPNTDLRKNARKKDFIASLEAADFYYAFDAADLRQFAHDRQVQLPDGDLSQVQLVSHLAAADLRRTFHRFLDLPPELRTRVYENLLVLNNSFTCYPSILGVCKQIHQEAANILDGDNLFEVKMWKFGVYAHGRELGPSSQFFWNWPYFFHRAQFIRISMGEDLRSFYSWCPGHLRQIQEYIVFSLCAFLAAGGHRLRSLCIDFALDDPVPFDVYATRMLGNIPELQLDGSAVVHDHGPEQSLHQAIEAAEQAHRDFKDGLAQELVDDVEFGNGAAWDERIWYFAQHFDHTLRRGVTDVGALRRALRFHHDLTAYESLREEIKALLHRDIDVRTARRLELE